MQNNIYVYRHIRLDTNQVFYIGIGSKYRPFTKNNRNKWWKNIVNKTNYIVEIIAKNLNYEDAKELETFLIFEYGRKDLNKGSLVNLTNGGEGNQGWNPSLETREKMRKNNLGKKMKTSSKEKCRIAGKKGSLNWQKKVICTKTNKTWDSITDCAKELNIKMKTLSMYLNGKRKNNTTIIYINNEK